MTEVIKSLIQKPESETLEYRKTLVQELRTAKSLSAFANTKGGYLVVGIDDNGSPVGISDP